jgi:hypothetical protein
MLSKRLSRVTDEAITRKAEILTTDATARLADLEAKFAAVTRQNEVLQFSTQYGVDADLLEPTGLSGESLAKYAEKLQAKLTATSVANVSAANAELRSAISPSGDGAIVEDAAAIAILKGVA